MRTILLLACAMAGLCLPVSSAAGGDDSLRQRLGWIEGHWERTDLPEGRSGYEHWQADGRGFAGTGALWKGAQLAFREELRIDADGDDVFYLADVPGNPAPVRFRMIALTGDSVAFENPAHDFPKKIVYRRDGDRLQARISANGREMTLAFQRAAGDNVLANPTTSIHADSPRSAMRNMINWFEIPAADFHRAMRFYAAVLAVPLVPVEMGGTNMGMLPGDGGSVSGAIVFGDGYVPARQGTLVYLSGGDDLSPMLARVTDAGGQVIVPKTRISPEFGYFALFIDTESNRVGLHSPR